MEQIIIFGVLIFLGLTFGMINERNHYESLSKRESTLKDVKLVNLKKPPFENSKISNQKLVMGSTVVSIDFFKLFVAGIKSLFGGRLKSYESLLERARREAVLRMREKASDFDMILNVRIETSSIAKGDQNKSVGGLEVLAYGTAIKVKES